MHNWSLLLLALLAVFEPIASFSSRSLVNGREQCSDHRDQSLIRDSRLSLHRDRGKPTERFLRVEAETRGVRGSRRYEVRDGFDTWGRVIENRAREATRRNDLSRISREDNRRTRDSRDRLLNDRGSHRFVARTFKSRDGLRQIAAKRSEGIRDERNDERSFRNLDSNSARLSKMLDETRREARSVERARYMPRSAERTQSYRKKGEGEVAVGRTSREGNRMSEMTRPNERRFIEQRENSERRGSSERRLMNNRLSIDVERRSLLSQATRNREESTRINREFRVVRAGEDANRDSRRAAVRTTERPQYRNENKIFRTEDRYARRDSQDRRVEREVLESRSRSNFRREGGEFRSESRSGKRQGTDNRRNAVSRSKERSIDLATRNIRPSNLMRDDSRSERNARDLMRRESFRFGDIRQTNEREARKMESRDQRSDVRRFLSRETRPELRKEVKRDHVARFRNVDVSRSTDEFSENVKSTSFATNLPYFFYTLQGIYICSIIIHVFGYGVTDKKKSMRSFDFWTSSSKMIKAD